MMMVRPISLSVVVSQLSFAAGFVAPTRTYFPHTSTTSVLGSQAAPKKESKLCTTAAAKERDDVKSTHKDSDPDSAARRRILFSLLASASTAGLTTTAIPEDAEAVLSSSSSTTIAEAAAVAAITNIMRPPLDKRKYESYVLENGLRVLLCSDPSSNEAAAAMDVHVGACSDPPEVPGLAHFNEHMLFLGTKEYPKEDSFSTFLSANGGSSNAFTDSEDTVYYFQMDAEAGNRLKEGLLRFGSFFSSPLFTESATGRELNAIESENAKNLQNDIFRLYQVEKARINSNHPYSKFFTGNKSTLLDGTKAQGIDLRQELIKFYEKHYSANQMDLAIVAPQPIETLKQYVAEAFSSIPNRQAPSPEEAWANVPPYQEGQSIIPATGHIVEILPVQDLRQVSLTWPVVFRSEDDREDTYLNKPVFFVSHLIGHEGPGSLLSYLKKEGWVNALGASTNTELSDFETFEITVELTSKGLGAIDDVCEVIFSYINMLRNGKIPDYVFNEVLQLSELEWRYLTKGEPSSYVQSLVSAMNKYPPNLYVAGPRRLALKENSSRLITSSDPRTSFTSKNQREIVRSATSDLLSQLTVDNVMLTALSKSFAGKTDKVEKWYGTEYSVRAIPSTTLARWSNCGRASDFELALPRRNVFIPNEAGLRVKKKVRFDDPKILTFEQKMTPVTPPSVIRDDGPEGRWTVYFKQDDRFGQPKAFMIFELLTKEVYSSPKQACLAQLYQTCAADLLNEYTYDAGLAGLSYNLQVLPRGVRLTFGGYNDKLRQFASYVAGKLARDFDDVLPQSDAEFDRYKDNIMRALTAFDVKQAYAHSIYYSSLTQQPRYFQYTNEQLRNAMRTTTLPELVTYVKSLWASGKGEALIQGNFDQQEALEFVDAIDKTLAFRTISKEEYPPRLKALPLPSVAPGTIPTRLTVAEPNPSNNNAATHLTMQSIGKTERDHVLIEILAAIAEEPFYEDLRTKQQLGYIVSSGVRAVEETRTLGFIVQSSVAPVSKLTSAILNFVGGFRKNCLEPLSTVEVELFVKGLLDKRLEPDKRLEREVTRNWNEVATGRLQFDRIQKEAAALLDITKDDIITFWDKIYEKDRRLLLTEVVPRSGPASSKEPLHTTGYASGKNGAGGTPDMTLTLGIDDIEQFRRDREILVEG